MEEFTMLVRNYLVVMKGTVASYIQNQEEACTKFVARLTSLAFSTTSSFAAVNISKD